MNYIVMAVVMLNDYLCMIYVKNN